MVVEEEEEEEEEPIEGTIFPRGIHNVNPTWVRENEVESVWVGSPMVWFEWQSKRDPNFLLGSVWLEDGKLVGRWKSGRIENI